MARPAQPDDIVRRVQFDTNGGCWLWTGAVHSSGYGRMAQRRAHRASYEAYRTAIPAGQNVLHRCDVRTCVNPDHLFLGSYQDNSDDKVAKRRHRFGESVVGSKLTDEIVREIRASPKGYRVLSRIYGVDRCTIRYARSGRTWRHV